MFGFFTKFLGHFNFVRDVKDSTITIDNSVHHGITDKTLNKIITRYEKDIADLEAKLSHSLLPEEKFKLQNELAKAKQEFEKKSEEVARLQKTIDDIQPNEKILTKAKEILDTQGVDEAIEYLQSSEVRAKKSMVDELMIEQAKQSQLEAQLLIVQNRYYEAKTAYEDMLKYDRSGENLFEIAVFLKKQNYFKNAKRYYTEALELYRALAKTNPDVDKPDVATILNNLANLEKAENNKIKAKEYYLEALEKYQELSKINPITYTYHVVIILNNLAHLEYNGKDNKQARTYLVEALEKCRTNSSVYMPNIALILNNLANLEADENYNEKAREYYTEALDTYRELAKTNPSVYKSDVAMTLNNLAILERDENHNEQARTYYIESLDIIRALAKTNPDAYEINYANSLLTEVYLFNENRENLDEARKILSQERHKNIYRTQKLFDFANSL